MEEGGTFVGIKLPDFVVLGCDCKTTKDGGVASFNEVKIHKYNDFYGMVVSGHSDDLPIAQAKLTSFGKDFANNTSKAVAGLYEPGARWRLMIGGISTAREHNGVKVPFLESVDPNRQPRFNQGQNFYAMGSGAKFAEAILMKMPSTPLLKPEHAVMWVERALVNGALYDASSGGSYIIRVIERGKEYEYKGEWILSDLWNKHAVYFKENFGCKFGELPHHLKHAWIEGWELGKKGWEEQWYDEICRSKNLKS